MNEGKAKKNDVALSRGQCGHTTDSGAKVDGKMRQLFLLAVAVSLKVSTAIAAAMPVVVWDGDAVGYTFDIRSRAVGSVAYTMTVNPGNASVSSANDCITIGGENQKWTVKITADSVGAFGNATNGFTVIAKVSNAGTSASSNRALLNYFTGDHQAAVAFAQAPYGKAFPMVNDNAWSASATTDGTLSTNGNVQTLALAYDTAEGVRLMVDGVMKWDDTAYAPFAGTPEGLTIGGVPIDGSGKLFAMSGMKIYAVAVFTNKLSDAEVAEYAFPSEQHVEVTADTTVSAINARTSATTKTLYLHVADGVTITGDATFATTVRNVHFICNGSFTLTPPADNTAEFNFSRVTGRPVIEYASLPTVSGSAFTSTTVPEFVTNSTKWAGVIYISGGSFTDFTSNAFGNESSIVRLGSVSGWLRAPGNYAFTNTVPVELVGTLTINNGNSANDSNPNRCTVFKKLSGNGAISTDEKANKVVVVIQDASEFTGNIEQAGKLIVFGDAMPSYNDNNKFEGMTASIWVMADAKVTNRGFWWAVGGIKVYGELRAAGLGKFGGGTYITTSDTGVFTLIGSDNTQDQAVDYARITGTGTLRYADASGKWRTLSAVNFPTGMICENNLSAGLILTTQGENTIGSLAGSGSMRSDWGGSKNVASRTLKILQSKDTEYSGVFHTDDRIGTVTVAPGATSAGTLTLSGTQTVSNDLVVESDAKVNLTGTWIGSVTVNGTISGTGTVDGDLTLEDGATIEIDLDRPLVVRGKIIEGDGVTINPRRASLNGTAQSLEETLRLMGLFGGDALADDGVTFNIGGIDMSDGTIRLDVSPAVAAGCSLSVFGKAALGDRWQRLKVNPEGSVVSIIDEDLADCRFFQIRAEFGEQTSGYAVSENPSVGDGVATEGQSHFASLDVGGSTALFTFSLEGGTATDYGHEYYKTLAFQVEGVTAGTVATLSTNGTVAASAKVGEDGSVFFGNVPPLESGMSLSFGIATTNGEGLVTTAHLGERAGVLSYEWGDSVTNEVSGGVTNVVTMLANRPFADGMQDSGVEGWYRIPAMAKATNGVVVALYDCRLRSSGDLPNSIDWSESWSGDGGVTWTKPRKAIDLPNVLNQAVGKETDITDPCILYDSASDRFFAMGITGGGLTQSHVNGVSVADVALYVRGTGVLDPWQEWTGGPVGNKRSVKQMALDGLAEAEGDEALRDENAIRGVLQGPGHGFVQRKEVTDGEGDVIMPSGALVFPMQFFPGNNFTDTQNFALYSTNGGVTWVATALTPTNTPAGKPCYAQEGCIVELDDGTWEYMAKYGQYGSNVDTAYGSLQDDDAREDCRLFFRSKDFKTWSFDGYHPHKSIRSQGSCLWLGDAVKKANGGTSLYAACFSTWGNYPQQRRGGLKLFFGRDTSSVPGQQGITWDCGELEIRHEHTSACSYNSMAMLDDKTLAVLFESDGHIYLRKVNLNRFFSLNEDAP